MRDDPIWNAIPWALSALFVFMLLAMVVDAHHDTTVRIPAEKRYCAQKGMERVRMRKETVCVAPSGQIFAIPGRYR